MKNNSFCLSAGFFYTPTTLMWTPDYIEKEKKRRNEMITQMAHSHYHFVEVHYSFDGEYSISFCNIHVVNAPALFRHTHTHIDKKERKRIQ